MIFEIFGNLRKSHCPYCKEILERRPYRKKACPHCGNFIFVRTRPRDRKRVLVTKKGADEIDAEWRRIHGTDEIFEAEQRAFLEMKEKLRRRFNKEPSDYDVKWALCNQRLIECSQKINWGLYRVVRFEMAELLKKEGRLRNALEIYLEVLYLDQNGPSDCEFKKDDPELLREFPPFDPKMVLVAPGIIDRVRIIVKKLKIPVDEVHKSFIQHNKKIHQSLKLPVLPEKAWQNIGSEFKKVLK